MKVIINGITYEGTYEEITKIVDRMTPKMEHNPDIPYKELMKETNEQLIERLREGMRTGSGQADWLVRYPAQPNTRTFTTTGMHEMQFKPMCQCIAYCNCSNELEGYLKF